eukprot:Colp12_sorted_trinity150504_noHs@6208
MSWQAYVDNNLVGTGCVSKAALCGHDGSAWATSAGFGPAAKEVGTIVNAIKSDPSALAGTGVVLAGTKYMFLRGEKDRSVYAKSKDGGAIVVKTGQAVIVAVYEGGIQPGACAAVVEKLADYLIEVGY